MVRETAQSAPKRLLAEVVRVVDGDTFDVKFQDGSTDRIRLLGVDTPETYSSNEAYEYGDITDMACLDAWGSQGESRVPGSGVTVEGLDEERPPRHP